MVNKTRPARARARIDDSARVARHVENVLARPLDAFYAFVYEITEGCDDSGRWIVDMELLAKDWWDRAWPDIAHRDGGKLTTLLGGSEFEDVLSRATPDQLALMYDVHHEFMMRMIDRGDPADVGLYQVVLSPTPWERDNLRIGGWYLVQLTSGDRYAPVADYGAAPERTGVFSRHALNARDDPPPELRRLQALDPPKSPMNALLPALHWPHPTPSTRIAPQPPGDGRVDPSRASDPSSPASNPSSPSVAARAALHVAALQRWFTDRLSTPLADTFSTWKEDLLRWLDDLGPPPPLTPAFAGAGGPCPSPTRRPPALPHDNQPIQYTGAPLTGPLGPQVANPMLPAGGPHQPFVGVLNVGQGNLNALYDDNGRIFAYYDFGSPVYNLTGTAPATEFAPCLHDDPIIIISHWDYDHIGMARRHPNARYMRWLVPQQRLGAASARGVYSSLLVNGLIYIWPGVTGPLPPPRQHIPMPWGYLERGLRNNQTAAGGGPLNHGGLVMYVCAGDAAAPVVAPARPVLAAPFLGRAAPPHLTAATLGANNADIVVTALLQHAQITATAAAIASCELDVGNGLIAASVPAAEVGRAAEAATLALAAGATGWLNILQAMGVPVPGLNAGATTLAATALRGAFTGGLAAHAGPSASASLTAVPVAVAALAGGGVTLAHLVAAAAVADAVIAAVGGLAAATLAAHASAFAISGVAGVMLPPALDPTTAAAGHAAGNWLTPFGVIARSRQVARSTMGAGAGAASFAGAAPVFSANHATLAACLAVAAGPGRNGALLAMTFLLGNPIGIGAGALQPVLVGIGGATVAAAVGAAGGAVASVVGPIAIASIAAAAACADAAQALASGLGASVVTAHADAAAAAVLADAGIAMTVVPAPLLPTPVYGGTGPTIPPLTGPAIDLFATGVIQAGNAPYDLNERYIHLTGDVGFHYMPSQNQTFFLGPPASPVCVGLLPSHHGAFTTLNEGTPAKRLLAKCLVPWAPGTAAAHAAAAAGATVGIPFGVSPPLIARTVAAALAYAAGVVARFNAVPNPNAAIPFATVARLAEGATEAAYPAMTTWAQALLLIARPAAPIPAAAELTAAACRFVPVLAAFGGWATLAAAVAAVGPMGPGHDLRRAPTAIEMAVCFALADALAAILAAPPYPGVTPPAVLGATNAIAMECTGGMPLPSTVGGALAGTAAGVAAAMGGAAAQHAAHAVGVMTTDLAAMFAVPPVPPAQIGAAASAAVAAAGGGWRAMIDAMWDPAHVGATGSVGVAAAALSRPLAALLPPPATAVAALVATLGALPPPGPTPQELAAVAAAIDAAIAVQQLPAGDVTAAGFATDAAWNAASAVTTAAATVGVVIPARREVFPGALVNPRLDIPTATVEAAIRPFFAAVGAGGALAAAAVSAQNLSTAHAQAVATLPESGKILYSYGIIRAGLPAAGTHTYPSAPGAFGHPHPHAVAIYEGHGWTSRLNTPTNSNVSQQPDPFPGPGALAGGGHIAMGWEVALPHVGPLQGDATTAGVVTRCECRLCGAFEFSC